MTVEIFTSNFCGFCYLAKKILIKRQIEFVEIDLDIEPNKRTEMSSRSGGKTSVPQIFFSNLHIGGYKELEIMERQGKLDPFSIKN